VSPQKRRNIPERLKQNNRPSVQEFDPQELLFLRFIQLIQEGGYFYPASIGFPDFSVNRGRFSEPEDVLLPIYLNLGIATFNVEDIPDEKVFGEGSSQETVYSFVIVHVPEPDNYAHSEIRTKKNGVYNKKTKIKNKEVKRYFRYKLSEKIKILRHLPT
jgi:hypothetical protein